MFYFSYVIKELMQNYEAEETIGHSNTAGQGGFIQLSNQKTNSSEKRLCCG
jgi:hypothetical protein